jgi:plasmid stabilization system protein ParE
VLEKDFTPEWDEDVVGCYIAGIQRWGEAVADDYDALIRHATEAIATDPFHLTSRVRPDLGNGARVRSLSSCKLAAGAGRLVRNPAHFVIYRHVQGDPSVLFLRLVRGAGLVPQLMPERL